MPASGPVFYQLHAVIAWNFWRALPFARLVHAWTISLQYIGPCILRRRRLQPAR